MSRPLCTLAALAGLALLAAAPGRATATGPDGFVPAAHAQPSNPDVTIEEKIGELVPLDVPFRDEAGNPITLRECATGKATILVPMYYRCPKLCNIVLQELLESLRKIPGYNVGTDFNVVCVSFDPKEQPDLAASKRKAAVEHYGRPGAEASLRFLTGTQDSIVALTRAVGFKYEYDRTFKEYNHPSGLIILTPEGKVARYFYGIRYDGDFAIPGGTTTLRLSLVEASEGKMGSLSDRLILTCYSFEHGTYGFRIKRAVQLGGLLTLLGVGTWVGLSLRRERRRNAAANRPNDAAPPEGTA